MRVLVITGAGRGFSAGADLKRDRGENADMGEGLRSFLNGMILDLYSLEKPTIAAVNGVAAGMGFSIATACDYRIASDQARFVAAFARIGLVPDCGLNYFLPQLIGIGRAIEILTLGGEINAQEALTWGLVNRVVPTPDFESTALEFATRVAKGPTVAIGMTKRLIKSSFVNELSEVLTDEADSQTIAGKTIDFKEGVRAFLEKRPAQFIGQ
jgi:2-(1,2-epoxy-1,2-dihydrophenyl)acetyl-CoA isomerase